MELAKSDKRKGNLILDDKITIYTESKSNMLWFKKRL